MAFTLAQEWKHETAQTRRILERVPQEHLSWKPHEKSMSLGGLAQHIANIPSWADACIVQDEYVFTGERMAEMSSVEEIIGHFERTSAQMLQLLEQLDTDTLDDSWSLKAGGQVVLAQPRAAAIRTFLLSHLIHHRGQLSVYLRLLDVAVPGLYGPSADER